MDARFRSYKLEVLDPPILFEQGSTISTNGLYERLQKTDASTPCLFKTMGDLIPDIFIGKNVNVVFPERFERCQINTRF